MIFASINRLLATFFALFLTVCCTGGYGTEDHSIIFIHIGENIPDYAAEALIQARKFNPDCPIYMIANQNAYKSFSPLVEGHSIDCISCESLTKTREHKKFIKKSTLNGQWREGFWRYTSERFLYLYDCMKQYDLKHVFHMEYDNMLYANLSTLLGVFNSIYRGIAATFDNDKRCVPGFVYIKNSESMSHLAKCFATHAKMGLNDMEVLALFKKRHTRELIDYLPIIPKDYTVAHKLKSDHNHIPADPKRFYEHAEVFQSIFDAAAIGQYLGGVDPRNGHSKPGFINESCIFQPNKTKIEWHQDGLGRKIPYIVYPKQKYRINNLHIHSKNLKRFRS